MCYSAAVFQKYIRTDNSGNSYYGGRLNLLLSTSFFLKAIDTKSNGVLKIDFNIQGHDST